LDYVFVGLAEIWVFKPLTFPKSAASSVHVPYEIHGQSMSWVYLTSTGSQDGATSHQDVDDPVLIRGAIWLL